MKSYQQLTHEFRPVFNEESRILILGTFPSVKSREEHFYYGHPQNRFWKVLAAVTDEPVPIDILQKKQLLLNHHIALWDVIKSCEIIGSSDSSIRNVIPADIGSLLKQAPIAAIFGNGNKACELFQKYTLPMFKADNISKPLSDSPVIETVYSIRKLPSTSPANAAWSLERLIYEWKRQIDPFLF